MQSVMPYLIIGLAIAVVIVLLFGIVNMVRKTHNPQTSNRLMRWRVGLQLGAVLLLILFLLFGRG
jgi:amino acid transporter